jgi:hypothetical protein
MNLADECTISVISSGTMREASDCRILDLHTLPTPGHWLPAKMRPSTPGHWAPAIMGPGTGEETGRGGGGRGGTGMASYCNF